MRYCFEELRRITYTARTKERQFAEFINQKSSSGNRRELNAKQREYERLSKKERLWSLMHCSKRL